MNIYLEQLIDFFSEKGPLVLLESQSDTHPWSRKSYLAADPTEEIIAFDDRITIRRGGRKETRRGNPWDLLRKFQENANSWLFGYLGYDLKNHIEKLESHNPDPVQAPDLYFMKPGFLLELDHHSPVSRLIEGVLPWRISTETVKRSDPSLPVAEELNISPVTSAEAYMQKIKVAQKRIAEGDFYEINLSHQLKGRFEQSPYELYRRMRQRGPVPFGSFINVYGIAVCSQSPERFLRKEGSRVFSQPIKGTAGRGRDEGEDRALKQQLIRSGKERAENLMIVDLVRNDMSKIAGRGTVKVPELFSIESFGTVHQMVSTVEAEVEEKNPVAILKACFPMGSMTGAPKINAMKFIEELEDYRRGIYSGAIGYITPQNDFDFNVVIRTAIIKNKELYYPVGGAVTADSDPGSEWAETLIKARALSEISIWK